MPLSICPPPARPSAPSPSCLARRSWSARCRFSSHGSPSLQVRRARAVRAEVRPEAEVREAVDEEVLVVAVDVPEPEVAVLVAVAVE